MAAPSILYLLMGITLAGYLFNTLLEYLNLRSGRRDIPEKVAAFYDRDKYL